MEQGREERRRSRALETALPCEGGSSVTLAKSPSLGLSERSYNMGAATARAAPVRWFFPGPSRGPRLVLTTTL